MFSVSASLAFQSVDAVFRGGLVDSALVNAVMLALVFAVTESQTDTEYLGYQYEAIKGIRERMSHIDEATSESTIGAILLVVGVEVCNCTLKKIVKKVLLNETNNVLPQGSSWADCADSTTHQCRDAYP